MLCHRCAFCFVVVCPIFVSFPGKKSLLPTKKFLPHSTCLNVTLGDRRRTEQRSSFEVNTLVNFTEKNLLKNMKKRL